MPTKKAKSPKAKAAVKKPKLTAKPLKKTVSAAPKKSAAPRSTPGPVNFMWKLLEKKQQALKTKESVIPSGDKTADARPHVDTHGFGRFHGPRRRVG